MVSAQTIEERLTAVEAKLEQLQREKEQNREQNEAPAEEPRGWKRIVGIFANDPEFEEAEKAGKEWRDSFRPPDYGETS